MRRLVLLSEELEARTGDADRVAALAGWFAEVGRDAAVAGMAWLLPAERGRRSVRPARIPLHRLGSAAREVALERGVEAWLFDAGVIACRDPAEAIALNLPDIDADPRAPLGAWPTLSEWMSAWRAAAATEDPDERVRAVVRLVARLEDRPTRRWAIRAASALGRPTVDPWQWMRAWADAYAEDLATLAWRWHTQGRIRALSALPDPHAPIPRPRPFLDHRAFDVDRHAGADIGAAVIAGIDVDAVVDAGAEVNRNAATDLLATARYSREPNWRGPRVQIVRNGEAIALWHHEGELLNARLEPLLFAAEWPMPAAIEGVLIGWHEGRAVSPWLAAPSTMRLQASGTPSLHLVLTDWHRWEDHEASTWALAERRQRLRARWPAFETSWIGDVPPPVFVTSELDAAQPPAGFWRGHLLRAVGRRGEAGAEVVWHVTAPRMRVRAVLQYVPADALAVAGRQALRVQPSGFALWTRAPRSARERAAAMAFSLSPLTEADPDDVADRASPPEPSRTHDLFDTSSELDRDDAFLSVGRIPTEGPAPRLVPLARLPLTLSDERLAHLHAWIRKHAGPRFGAMNTVLPALVFALSFDTAHPSHRHRAGWILEDARVEDWLEAADAGACDDLGSLGGTRQP